MPFPNLCSVLFKSMPGTLALRLPHLLHTTVPIKFTGDYFAWLCFSQCSSFEQSVFFSDGVWLGGKNTFILSTIKKNPSHLHSANSNHFLSQIKNIAVQKHFWDQSTRCCGWTKEIAWELGLQNYGEYLRSVNVDKTIPSWHWVTER